MIKTYISISPGWWIPNFSMPCLDFGERESSIACGTWNALLREADLRCLLMLLRAVACSVVSILHGYLCCLGCFQSGQTLSSHHHHVCVATDQRWDLESEIQHVAPPLPGCSWQPPPTRPGHHRHTALASVCLSSCSVLSILVKASEYNKKTSLTTTRHRIPTGRHHTAA